MANEQNKHQPSGRRRKLSASFRFAPALLVVAAVTVVGIHYVRSSSAATITIQTSGRIVNQRGQGVPGIVMVHCQNGAPKYSTTNGNGFFYFNTQTITYGGTVPEECIRPSGWPGNYSRPVANNSRSGQATYEYQAAGLNCYTNTNNCGQNLPAGSGFHTSNQSLYFDIDGDYNTDTHYNFSTNYTDNAPPSTPSLGGSAVSTSQINLNWSAASDNWSGISSYTVYRNGAVRATVGGTSFNDTGLIPNTAYSYTVRAKDGSGNVGSPSNTISPRTFVTPTNPGNPSNPSNPSKPSGGSGGSRPSGGSTGGGGSAAANTPPDTIAPSTPGNLSATADDQNKSVKLTWDTSTDNVGIASYAVERSTDQQDWAVVADKVTDTNYEDTTVAFGSTLYYRVRAMDAAGNTSDYSTAQVTTSDFSANAHADKDNSVDSEDGAVTVQIPSGAVPEDVFCTVTVVKNILSPDVDGYQTASGPYEITCRKKDGTVLGSYDKSLNLTVKLSSNTLKKAGKLAYYGQKDTVWDKLSITGHNKKAKTDTVNLGDHQIFSIMKQHKKKSAILTFFEVIIILLLIVGAVVLVLRFIQRRKLQGQYDDYLHKSRGY